jgi:hypothetical protein
MAGSIRFVVLRGLGDASVTSDVPVDTLRALLEE